LRLARDLESAGESDSEILTSKAGRSRKALQALANKAECFTATYIAYWKLVSSLTHPNMQYHALKTQNWRLRDILQSPLPSLNPAHPVFSQIGYLLEKSKTELRIPTRMVVFRIYLSRSAFYNYKYIDPLFPPEERQISIEANHVVEFSESTDTKPPRRPYVSRRHLFDCNLCCSVHQSN